MENQSLKRVYRRCLLVVYVLSWVCSGLAGLLRRGFHGFCLLLREVRQTLPPFPCEFISPPYSVPFLLKKEKAFIGAGFNIIFQQCLNFLVDTYGPFAASAVSANTMLRSLVACGLPLAVRPMFDNMGVGPGCSLLGGIAVLALPVPWLLTRYATVLRTKESKA